MKKLLAITLSLLMVFTVIPMAIVSASSVATSKTIVDFEDGSASILSSQGDQPVGIVDTSTLSDAKAYWTEIAGAYCIKVSGKKQSTWVTLPTDWAAPYEADGKTYARPNEISFDITGSENTSRGISISSIALVNSSNAETYLKALTKTTSAHNAKITVSYKIPVSLDLSNITKFKMNIWGTNVYVYVDNIKVNYYDSFTATFSGTETAELASPVDSIDQNFTNDETSIVLPDVTLGGGKTLAGWVTEADSATVLPAGTEVSLEDDTDFYAVATDRGPYPTPDAPTVSAKTFNSVTLTALGSDYVYSKDGTTWQESNVFTSLAPSTEYTFYTKHIATLAYDESAVSAGTTVTTDVITQFEFSKEYVTLSDNTAKLQFDTGLAYKCITANVAVDKGVTVTTNYTVAPGVYDLTLYARSYGTRAQVDIDINGNVVGESVNTSATGSGGDNVGFALSPITIPETTVLTIKITTKTAGNLYLNSLKLNKTGEYVPPAITMQKGASIRLGDVNGIRFYTTVNEESLATLTGGADYEIGTIIAPVDAIGEDGELTATDDCAIIPFKARNEDGSIKYHDADKKQIAGSIVNIRETGIDDDNGNIDREFVARAYVKVGDTYYYSATTSTRSLQAVASSYQNDNYGGVELDATVKKAVDNWAAGKSATAE